MMEWYSPLFKTANELYGNGYMRTILIYHLKERSGGIIQEIKRGDL